MTMPMPFQPLQTKTAEFAMARRCAVVLIALCVCCSGCKSIAKRDECASCAVAAQQQADTDQQAASNQQEQLAVQPAGYPFSPPVVVQPFPTPDHSGDHQDEAQGLAPYDTEHGLTLPENKFATPPIIAGTHLGAAQITATEHALRLKDENEQLKSSRASLLSDNQLLKDQVAASRDLLNRMSTAISQAEQTLENAERANQELVRQVADVQRQQQRDQLNADRALQSIRDELDDVLMREITSTQQ